MAEGKNNFGTYHISSDLENYEVARSNFFTLVVDNLDDLVRSDFALENPTEADKIKNGQEVVKLSVTKAFVPHFSVDTLSFRRGNSVIKYAGNPTFDDGDIEVQDFVGLGTKSVLMAWQALTYNVNTDKGGRAADYKRDCTLIEYTQDYQEIRRWKLIGCFISKLSEDAYDMSNGDDRKITATISYDRAVMKDPDTKTTTNA